MAYGLADVVNQRRMIDESPAEEAFKRAQRGKLDALLSLAEAYDCRRVRLLAYFGEPSAPCAAPQNACDNCANPPRTWDATEAARKALSCVYRFHQGGGQRFGAVHLIDVLRGKMTDKVTQYGHRKLSTFAIGADLSEAEWRAVLRQLIALGHLKVEGEFNTLELTESARAVLRGEVRLLLRQQDKPSVGRKGRRGASETRGSAGRAPLPMSATEAARFAALKAWRATVARAHGVPAYVVFHDAALAEMAHTAPQTLAALAGIGGVGAKKLEAFGRDILRVLGKDKAA
jgi:ATP-dependent DNA helicase RecQ